MYFSENCVVMSSTKCLILNNLSVLLSCELSAKCKNHLADNCQLSDFVCKEQDFHFVKNTNKLNRRGIPRKGSFCTGCKRIISAQRNWFNLLPLSQGIGDP